MKRFPYVSMSSLKALAKGGMSIYGARKYKKTYKKKTYSKKKYKKTFKGKSKKVPDQRWTRMEYGDTMQGQHFGFTGNSNVRYMGFQNTGGMVPLTRVLAGSIVRDILGKNGIKYATWNSSAEGSIGQRNIYLQRCGKIKFFFRGQNPEGELVERTEYQKRTPVSPPTNPPTYTYSTADTEVLTFQSHSGGQSLRTLWDITEEVRDMFVSCAQAGFYPVSYEVMVIEDVGSDAYVTKFRDPNFGMASVNMSIVTDLTFTNQTPANNTSGTDKYDKNRSDAVTLNCKQYKFRNLAPFFRDDLLTATTKPLSDGSPHPFNDMYKSQKMDWDQGVLDLGYWSDAAQNMFRPLTSPPNGAVVFKNLASTTDCGKAGPGTMTKKKLYFKYNGGLRSLLVQIIPQTKFCDPSTPTLSSADRDAKALLNRVSKGDSYVYAFSRVKNLNLDLSTPDVLVARKISTSCYVQPYKAAPLPVCRNPNPDFTLDPGYD